MTLIEAAKQAREAFEWNFNTDLDNIPACERWAKMLKENINALDKAIAKAEQEEPVTMDVAIVAGDSVLMNEQAALLRECRAALDSLIAQKPTMAGLLCGSTTLGNLRADLHAYRPQGVLGTHPPQPASNHTEQHLEMVEQPYGWIGKHSGEFIKNVGQGHVEGAPLYTTPPKREWQGLTNEEIKAEWVKVIDQTGGDEVLALARAIEAKLKEKNT